MSAAMMDKEMNRTLLIIFLRKDNEIFFANKNHPKKLIQFYNID